ncbi:hypothetical protein BRC69_03090 [Halobacteriales archaeon QH_6_66_25]|nr:MAG: hypothetical protein BRC69_03090 [Halobacteriales archaeon QH_6_66_25]
MTHSSHHEVPDKPGNSTRRPQPRALTDGGRDTDTGWDTDGPPPGYEPTHRDSSAAPETGGAAEASEQLEVNREKWDPEESDHVSRRAMLGYTGGSALATLGLASGVWYVFFRPTYGPEEDVVREYFSAIDRDHYNTARLLFHEESPDSLWAADRVTEVSQMDISVEDTEVRQRWENAERDSVEEYALVVAEVEMDSGPKSETFAIGILVAKNADGEWRIWRDEGESNPSE